MSVADTLLEWMSELGCGAWDDAREAAASLQSGAAVARPAWVIASELADSGHIELDWVRRQWSVASPALCLLPGTGLCAVWTGARPRRWQRRLDEAVAEMVSVFDFSVAQGEGPSARFVKARSTEDLATVADRLGLRFAVDPASALAERLVPVTAPSTPAARPVLDEEVDWLDAGALEWRHLLDIGDRRGLFRLERAGRKVGRWRDQGGEWWEIDLTAGLALATRGAREPLLSWAPPSRDLTSASSLGVRRPLALPELCRRVAVASSGLLLAKDRAWLRYRNVTRDNARRIAGALGHRLASTSAS